MKHLPFLKIFITTALLFCFTFIISPKEILAAPPACTINGITSVGPNWKLDGTTDPNTTYHIQLEGGVKSFSGAADTAGHIERDLGSGYARDITVTLICKKTGEADVTDTATLPAGGEPEDPASQCIDNCTPELCGDIHGKGLIWHCDLTKCHPGRGSCFSFGGVGCPPGGVNTAIGKIPCEPVALAGKIFSLALGVAGGIALLLVITGGYKIIASQGDPEALTSGKEIITSAIVGLLFIIFSAALLRIIGCNILGLPCG